MTAHTIGTTSPINSIQHLFTYMKRHTIMRMGLIEECFSPWSFPVILVKKKDGTTRFCVDYRKLNNPTVKDAYPLMRIDDSLGQFSDAKYNSTLDFNSGYWQVEVAEKTDAKLSSPQGKCFTVFKLCLSGFVMPQRRLNNNVSYKIAFSCIANKILKSFWIPNS